MYSYFNNVMRYGKHNLSIDFFVCSVCSLQFSLCFLFLFEFFYLSLNFVSKKVGVRLSLFVNLVNTLTIGRSAQIPIFKVENFGF